SVRRRPKSITEGLWIDLMLVQKFLKLIGVKIRQNFIACHKRRHVGLSRKLLHLLVRPPVFANVDFLEAIALVAEIILRINTPGTPLAAVKLQLHRRAEINQSPPRRQLIPFESPASSRLV